MRIKVAVEQDVDEEKLKIATRIWRMVKLFFVLLTLLLAGWGLLLTIAIFQETRV